MARQARHLDSSITAADKKKQTVEVLNFTAAVFHESRCGQHADSQSAGGRQSGGYRVYLESPPPVQALYQVCGEDYSSSVTNSASFLKFSP